MRIIDRVKYRKIHEEVMKRLDKLENEFLPQVMVDTTDIIFDVLKFLEPSSKELIIANTGQVSKANKWWGFAKCHDRKFSLSLLIFRNDQVPVQFEFIKKLDDTSYCKDWLHIEPYTGFIKPGADCYFLWNIFHYTFVYFRYIYFFLSSPLVYLGEKCDIKLEVYVDKRTACKLNSGEDKLYDILVLHLEGGKDIFITVTGTCKIDTWHVCSDKECC